MEEESKNVQPLDVNNSQNISEISRTKQASTKPNFKNLAQNIPRSCEFDLSQKMGMVIIENAIVGKVAENGQADIGGIKKGCKIIAIGTTVVGSLDEIRKAFADAKNSGQTRVIVKFEPLSAKGALELVNTLSAFNKAGIAKKLKAKSSPNNKQVKIVIDETEKESIISKVETQNDVVDKEDSSTDKTQEEKNPELDKEESKPDGSTDKTQEEKNPELDKEESKPDGSTDKTQEEKNPELDKEESKPDGSTDKTQEEKNPELDKEESNTENTEPITNPPKSSNNMIITEKSTSGEGTGQLVDIRYGSTDAITGEKKKKPKKEPRMSRPESAQWSQTDAILAAADEAQGGWHESALEGVNSFLETRAEADMVDASGMNENGRFQEAEAIYKRLLGDFSYSKSSTDPKVARAQLGLASSLDGQGSYEEALEMNKKAVDAFMTAFGEENADTADAWNNTGVTLYKMGHYEEAKMYLEKALGAYKINYGEEHALVARTLKNIGNVFKKEGKHEEALDAYKMSLLIYEKVMGEHSSAKAMTLNNMAGVFKKISKFDESVEYYKLSVKCYYQCIKDAENEQKNTQLRTDLGINQREEIELKQLSILRMLQGDEARARHNLGNVLYEFGRFEEAIIEFSEAVDTKEKLYGAGHIDTQRTRKLLKVTEKKLEQAIKRKARKEKEAKERAEARAAKKMALNASEVAKNAAKAAVLSVEQSEAVSSPKNKKEGI